MLAKIAGHLAVSKMESVTGVVLKVGAVEKIGLEMDVMVVLGELISINAYFTQVCTVWTIKCFMSRLIFCVLFRSSSIGKCWPKLLETLQ